MERAELSRQLGGSGKGPGGPASHKRPHIVCEREFPRFQRAFAAAVDAGGEVFVIDPDWPEAKRAQFEAMLKASADVATSLKDDRGWLMLASGGTSGGLKFARHDGYSLAAAVAGFREHFSLERVNAVGVLPLHHVSGLMAWLRCALTGGQYVAWDWKRLEAAEYPDLPPGESTLSLVPTQLQRLLGDAAAVRWLRRFRAVFVGGGPSWSALNDRAAASEVPVVLSYGMTETAAMVAAQRPGDFLAGARDCGSALPHVRLRATEEGRLAVTGTSVFRGYWPHVATGMEELVTEDLAELDAKGRLRILGRRDDVVISGGKKIFVAEVEAALRVSGQFPDVIVLGQPDPRWGERVVAFYPVRADAPDTELACAQLAPWQRPKEFIAVETWPRSAAGKVDRAALRRGLEAREIS